MVDQREIRGHVTTEQTSKSLKLRYAVAVCVIIVGAIVMFSGMFGAENGKTSTTFNVGGAMTFFGFVYAWITKIKMWWNHG